MKKLIPLFALAAGLVLAGCSQNGDNSNASNGATENAASMTNSSPAGTNAATGGTP